MAFNSVNFDRSRELDVRTALLPASYTTPQNGATIDCASAAIGGAKSVTFVVHVGAVTDGEIDLTFHEDTQVSMATETVIPATRVFWSTGTDLNATAASDEKVVLVTVIPLKRYVRFKTVETVASTGYVMGATALVEAA